MWFVILIFLIENMEIQNNNELEHNKKKRKRRHAYEIRVKYEQVHVKMYSIGFKWGIDLF